MTTNSEQLSLINEQPKADNAPVICLGMTFENEESRRKYFSEELRKKLPELKQIEGFPIGEDEDIIALSDPPYYTACPNPWLEEVILTEMQVNKNSSYDKLPFIGDIAEGKNDAVYNAHSYHTKVPYKAIMRYILHYTEPGDLVFDGFSGTGMTGVAAKRCGDKQEVEKLGYHIANGNVMNNDEFIGKIGERNIILSELSPAASLISQNYNIKFNVNEFEIEANKIIEKVENECSWLYKLSTNENTPENINHIVWSDVFICPSCANEIIFWDVSVNVEKKKIYDKFQCKHCSAQLEKKKLDHAWHKVYDEYLKETISMARQVPVFISYSIGTKRYEKKVDEAQLNLLNKIDNYKSNSWTPLYRMPEGDESRRNDIIGITHVHHYFTSRNLIALSKFYKYIMESKFSNQLLFFFQASITRATKTNRFRFGGTGNLSGTLYIPSLTVERNVILLLKNKLRDFIKMIKEVESDLNNKSIITTQSTTEVKGIPSNSIDYIFTDPPFGKNLMYSELNFLWESWLKILTDNTSEAIMNTTQKKTLFDYQKLMEDSFAQYFRVLKPGRWITIEFSNSQASVWNSIQESLQKVGFVIADVSALDKKQGSFKAVTTTTAVKQDLVITAYKPSEENIQKMLGETNTSESAWTFVNQHLEKLPIFLGSKGEASVIAERTPRILFDRMIAYHVQNGLPVPISSAEFQIGVAQRFPMRDGMAFLESQIAEYDKKRILVKDFSQMNLFVSDENSAIEWIRQQLMKKPQTRQDLHSQFMKEIQHIAKHEQLPELDDLLVQNFLRYEGDTEVPDQIAGYLRRNYREYRGLDNNNDTLKVRAMNCWYVPDPNKQADLEKLREKTLLRAFESYIDELGTHKKKLSNFRTEAVRAGFKKAWTEKDYKKIVNVGGRLPETVIQEDDKLLMYYDNAQIRVDMQ